MRRSPSGFKDNRVGALRGVGLNVGQQLLALLDAIIAGVHNLEINAQFAGCYLGGGGLLHLVIVVVVSEREQEAQLFHAEDVSAPIILDAFIADA
jgi:hypothetical protein